VNREQRRQFAREHGLPAMPPADPAPGPQLQVAPVPVTTTVGGVTFTDGDGRVTLQVVTPIGIAVYFLSGDHACDLAGHLNRFGNAARSGLVIAGDLAIPEPEVPSA